MNHTKSCHARNLLGGILAGIMIGIGGTVYLACENKVAGAVLFAVGLLTICAYGFKLFTGAIGYLLTDPGIPGRRLGDAAEIWLGNYLGTACVGVCIYLLRPALAEKAGDMVQAKLAAGLPSAFVMAIFCGVLMYLAVDLYRTRTDIHQLAGIFVAVPVFILAGFEHSIADMFYLAAGGLALPTAQSLLFLLTVTLGNAVGAGSFSWGAKILKTLQSD